MFSFEIGLIAVRLAQQAQSWPIYQKTDTRTRKTSLTKENKIDLSGTIFRRLQKFDVVQAEPPINFSSPLKKTLQALLEGYLLTSSSACFDIEWNAN